MSGAIYLAASGALLQQMRLEVLSNNLANINTAGFKQGKTVFSNLFEKDQEIKETKKNTDNPEISGKQKITPFTPPFGYYTDLKNGQLQQTGNQLDLSIGSKGFFTIKAQDGLKYTRNGNFKLDSDGILTTASGLPVMGKGGTIIISGENINVDNEGNLSVDGALIDTLKIVRFEKPEKLTRLGDTLFAANDDFDKGENAEAVDIRQGFLELSNVNAIQAMTEIIESMRVFESYQKVITSINDANGKAINEVGRPA